MFGRFKMGLTPTLGGSGATANYLDNVLALSPILYYPQNETSGTTADNAEGTADRDGTYVGATLANTASPMTGDSAPLYDGVNDLLRCYSASFDGVYSGAELTFSIWFKVFDADTWTDGLNRELIRLLADGSNYLIIRKTTVSNTLSVEYNAGGTLKTITTTSLGGNTDWNNLAATVSASNDRLRLYLNGSQVGVDTTGLGVYTGALASASTAIASATSSSASEPWYGWLSHASVFAAEKTGADITTLATAL